MFWEVSRERWVYVHYKFTTDEIVGPEGPLYASLEGWYLSIVFSLYVETTIFHDWRQSDGGTPSSRRQIKVKMTGCHNEKREKKKGSFETRETK